MSPTWLGRKSQISGTVTRGMPPPTAVIYMRTRRSPPSGTTRTPALTLPMLLSAAHTVHVFPHGRLMRPLAPNACSAGEKESAGPGSPQARLAKVEAEATALRARIAAQEAEATERAKSCLWWTVGAGVVGALVGSKCFA